MGNRRSIPSMIFPGSQEVVSARFICGRPQPTAYRRMRFDAGPDKRSFRVSFEKIARKLPQFKPQWDAKKGAKQLYEAYQASCLTLEEFEGPRYQRIGHIKKLMAEGILGADLRHHAEAKQLAV